jgi:hypothetical protein
MLLHVSIFVIGHHQVNMSFKMKLPPNYHAVKAYEGVMEEGRFILDLDTITVLKLRLPLFSYAPHLLLS